MNDYERGVFDCVMGAPHKKDQSFDYDRGYSNQFYKEKNLSQKEAEVENDESK